MTRADTLFTIWHDNDYDFAFWVYENSSLNQCKEDTILRKLPKTNKSKSLLGSLKTESDFLILPMIKYENPDIILQHTDEKTKESRIIFVTEFMTHTPQWQHPAQRFSRIYGASRLGIPVSLVLPRIKIKLEKGRSGTYRETPYVCSPGVYTVFATTSIINNCPTLLFHWPDVKGYLKNDPSHPTAPFKEDEIVKWFTFLDLALNFSCRLSDKFIQSHIEKLKRRGLKTISASNYGTIKGIFPTQKVISDYKLNANKLPKSFIVNHKTLVFEPTGLAPPSSYFRTDPYAGMLCAFDILFCSDKNGRRVVNLILKARDVELCRLLESGTFIDKRGHDLTGCPFSDFSVVRKLGIKEIDRHLKSGSCPYTSSKQQRIYGEVADIIVFEDSVYYR